MPLLMPDEDKNFGGSLVLDFRKCQPIIWRTAAMLRRRRSRAYAPTSNCASHDNHKCDNVFPFVSYMSKGLPFGPPELRYNDFDSGKIIGRQPRSHFLFRKVHR